MTQALAHDDAGACVMPAEAPHTTTAEADGQPVPGSRLSRRLRTAASWALLVLVAVLLWPAQWGGLTGLTVVSGHSMEPTYLTGDLVITWRSADYQVGDIVSYTVPADQPGAGGHVIHRVEAVEEIDGQTIYTTLGDNNPAPDQWALTSADITGAAVIHVPGIGSLLGTALLPYLAAGAIGAIVTVLLWSGRSDDEESPADDDIDGEAAA